jgi:hypothetical protein
MTIVLAMLTVVLGQTPDVDPANLVQRLGSTRFAEREEATAALEKLGPDALTALRAALDAKDFELKSRAAALIAKIEAEALTRPGLLNRPTLIRLDFVDRTLQEVVAAFGSRELNPVDWHPNTPANLRQQPVTFRDTKALPFWTAVDKVCEAGGLTYLPGSPGGPGDGQPPQFRLFLAPGETTAIRTDDGPLRLELVSIKHIRSINLVPNPKPAAADPNNRTGPAFGEGVRDLRLELRLLAEPRLLVDRIGDVHLIEGVDELGQSLLDGEGLQIQQSSVRDGDAQACISFQLKLKRPERVSKVIKRLRLTLPVEVVARRPDRLVIQLAEADGKEYRHGRTRIRVLDVTRTRGGGRGMRGPASIEMTLSSEEKVAEPLTLGLEGDRPASGTRPVRPEVTPSLIQVFDQQGRQFPWFGAVRRGDDGDVSATLTLWTDGSIVVPEPMGREIVPPGARWMAIPTELQHCELARAVIRPRFEFTDIPLP